MKVDISVEIEEFEVPTNVREVARNRVPGMPALPSQTPPLPSRSFKLSELDYDTLRKLCDKFTASVFACANKSRPEKGQPRAFIPLEKQLGLETGSLDVLYVLRNNKSTEDNLYYGVLFVNATSFHQTHSGDELTAGLLADSIETLSQIGLITKKADGKCALTAAGKYIAEKLFP